MSAPSPRDAPVTNATRPFRSCCMVRQHTRRTRLRTFQPHRGPVRRLLGQLPRADMHDRMASTGVRARRTGAIALQDDAVQFRVWAPNAQRVDLVLAGDRWATIPMERDHEGYFAHTEPNVAESQRYAYRLDGG